MISFIQPSFSGYFLCHQIKVISVQLLLVIILLFRKPRDNLCLPPYSLSITNSASYRAFATYLIKRRNLIPSTCTGSGISSVTKLSNTLSWPCVIRLRLDCRHIAQRKKVNRYFVRQQPNLGANTFDFEFQISNDSVDGDEAHKISFSQ